MMKGGMGNLLKQAKKMQEQMEKTQAELAKREITGEAGGGMVKVTMNGRHEVVGVRIDPSVAGGDDVEMLEDLVAAACNDAVRRVAEETQNDLSAMMPPGFKLPF